MSGNTPSSIKITALADIGNAISYTTLFPVVSMQGTPTTDKANLQIIGNIILNGAGGSYFPAAAQSLLALSVANAAQPNITSVGTLTALTVLANVNAGNINGGNIVNANFYYGSGQFLTNLNIANVVGLGNIATINLDGNVSNVLSGAGTWVPMTGGGGSSYIIYNGNSNVSIPSTDGSTVITANSGIAHRWVFDDQGNLTLPSGGKIENNVNSGEVSTTINDVNGVAITTGASVSGNGVFVRSYGQTDIYANGHVWVFDSDGNLTAPGNIIIDNGVDGNIESTGNVNVMSNGNTWQFGTDGNLTAPGNIQMSNIGGIYSSTSGYTVGLKMSNTEPSVKLVANNHEWQFNSDGVLKFPAGYSTTYPSITMGEPGNLLIQGYINGNFTEDGGNVIVSGGFGDGNNGNATVLGQQVTVKAQLSATNGSPTYSWTFDETGNLTLPQGGIITEGIIPGIGVVGNTIILTPSSGTSPTQQLLVYPTYGPDVNHLHLTSGNLANTELFLGNDDHYVKLVKTGEIEIRPNNGLTTYDSPSATWIFGKDANLSIPSSRNGNGSFVNSQTAINVSSGPYYLADIAPFATGGGMNTLSFHQDTCPGILNVAVGDTIHNVIGDYLVSTVDSVSQPNTTTITTTYNSGPQVTVNLFSFAKPGAAGGIWKFDEYGNLTVPGAINTGAHPIVGAEGILNLNDDSCITLTGINNTTIIQTTTNIADPAAYKQWSFGTDGSLSLPGVFIAQASDNGSIVFSENRSNDRGSIKVDGGYNMVINASSNFYVKRAGSDRLAITDTNTDLMASSNVVIHANKAGTEANWTFATDGNLTLPGNIILSDGAIVTNNIPLATFDILFQYDDLVWSDNTLTFTNASSTYMLGVLALMEIGDTITLGGTPTTVTGTYTGGGAGTFTVSGTGVGQQIGQFTLLNRLTTVNGIKLTTNSQNYLFTEAGVTQSPVLTVDTLPSGVYAIAGFRAFVSDANLSAVGNFGEIVGNGGANTVSVWCDGINWLIG